MILFSTNLLNYKNYSVYCINNWFLIQKYRGVNPKNSASIILNSILQHSPKIIQIIININSSYSCV